jgi:hypothetical protein
LTATFAAGVAFLRDARDAFCAGPFLTVLAFLRVAGFMAGVFLRFAFVFPLVFFFVAIAASRVLAERRNLRRKRRKSEPIG